MASSFKFLLMAALLLPIPTLAQQKCQNLFMTKPAPVIGLEEFRLGQTEILRTLYSLYRRRPDLRLQNLEVPGMTLRISPDGRPLKLESQISVETLESIPKNEQSNIYRMAEFYRWRKSAGTSQQLAAGSNSVIHHFPYTKRFGLPDDFDEMGANDLFTSVPVPESVRMKYPELFISRNRYLGKTRFEQSWNAAYQNLMQYLKVILQTPEAERKIKLNSDQLLIFQKIYQDRNQISPLKFISGRSKPKLFETKQANHRLAVTGDKPGSEIWLNSDFAENSIDIASMTGMLLHELGHHTGYKDLSDRPLDVVAALLTDFIRQTSEVKKINGPTGDIEIILFRPQMMTQKKLSEVISPSDMWGSRLLINDGRQIWDMTGDLFSAMANLTQGTVSFFSIKDLNIDIKGITGSQREDRVGYTFALPVQIIVKNFQTGRAESMTLESQVSFWVNTDKSKPGMIVWPTPQTSIYPIRAIPGDYAQREKHVPATVLSSSAPQSQTAGEMVEISALVQIPEGAEVASAWMDLSSPQMMNMIQAMPSQRIQISNGAGAIKVERISKDQVRVVARFVPGSHTNPKQLILESVNFIYRDGNYSYAKPPTQQLINIKKNKENKGISFANLKLGNGNFIFPPGVNYNMFSGQDAEVSFELSSVTSLSHSILVGEIHQIDEKGIVTKEGFSANLSAGNSPLIDNISSDPRFFNTTTDQEPLDKMFFKFSVSTKREIWGAHAKMVHLTGIYIRDFNLEERFIPFGANFAFHIK